MDTSAGMSQCHLRSRNQGMIDLITKRHVNSVMLPASSGLPYGKRLTACPKKFLQNELTFSELLLRLAHTLKNYFK
jgi:hypothetical protein